MTQHVSVGRIVHYCTNGNEPPPRSPCFHYDVIEKRSYSPGYDTERLAEGSSLAAMVTAVHPNGTDATLEVFVPGGAHFSVRCAHAETPTHGYWSWPPKV